MINKQLDQIDINDLNNLIENGVFEKKTIEYKLTFSGDADSDKKEFLGDISSLANASGGDLIYGIKEVGGLPTQIVGVELQNVDAAIRKYENIIRDGLDPRITFSTHTVRLDNGNIIFIFRINRSWIGPHRVIFKGYDKFYGRNSAGKYPLDTDELRAAFNLSQTLGEKITRFRLDRIADLSANTTPIPTFPSGAKVILHIIPFEAFSSSMQFDLSLIMQESSKLPPMFSASWTPRINLDGVITTAHSNKSYVQMYKNGIIEAVDSGMLQPNESRPNTIPGQGYEERILRAFTSYWRLLREFEVPPPFAIFLTLTGIRGYKISSRTFDFDEANEINQDNLLLPEKVVETIEETPGKILRSIFDLVWNSCGIQKSPNFDEEGNWVAI
jgi:hypothetical protein